MERINLCTHAPVKRQTYVYYGVVSQKQHLISNVWSTVAEGHRMHVHGSEKTLSTPSLVTQIQRSLFMM